jgi:hypothetical protein
MEQEISMVYLNEHKPCPRFFTSSDLRSLVGERHSAAGDLIVLEKGRDEVTVITSEEDSLCVEELRKVFLKDKKISVKVTEKRELHRLLTKICNFFGLRHSR